MQIFLGIVGDDLDPTLVSATLGGSPHQAGRKGDAITTTTSKGRVVSRPAMAGYWQRVVRTESPTAADSVIGDLFSGLTDDVSAWRMIGSRFQTGITVQDTSSQTAESIFSAATLALFEQRGLQVHVDED